MKKKSILSLALAGVLTMGVAAKIQQMIRL